MATLDEAFFKKLAPKAKPEIITGIVKSLAHLAKSGISEPLVLAHFFSQLSHESGGFRYVIEVWGPTPAQIRYDTRVDLGNTAAKDNDGYLYRGRGLIQLTGKANYRKFTVWAQAHFPGAPDFVKQPHLVAEFPWAILTAVWYFQVNDLIIHSLNPDPSAIRKITKIINGGYNGLADRTAQFDRIALLMLDQDTGTEGVKNFQRSAKLTVDGDLGPLTRKALMQALAGMASKVEVSQTSDAEFAQHNSRPAWTPNPKADFFANMVSYAFWAIGTFLTRKLFRK